MQMVGKRVVDRVDLGVGEQRLVGPVSTGVGQAELGKRRFSLAQIAGPQRHNLRVLGPHYPGCDLFHANGGGRYDAPANFAICHVFLLEMRIFFTGHWPV